MLARVRALRRGKTPEPRDALHPAFPPAGPTHSVRGAVWQKKTSCRQGVLPNVLRPGRGRRARHAFRLRCEVPTRGPKRCGSPERLRPPKRCRSSMPCSIRQRCGHRAPCEPPAQRAHLKRCGRLKPRQYGRSMPVRAFDAVRVPAGWESVLPLRLCAHLHTCALRALDPLGIFGVLGGTLLVRAVRRPGHASALRRTRRFRCGRRRAALLGLFGRDDRGAGCAGRAFRLVKRKDLRLSRQGLVLLLHRASFVVGLMREAVMQHSTSAGAPPATRPLNGALFPLR